MVGLQTLDLAIGVRVPASQSNVKRAATPAALFHLLQNFRRTAAAGVAGRRHPPPVPRLPGSSLGIRSGVRGRPNA